MAFVGISVFAVTLPSYTYEPDSRTAYALDRVIQELSSSRRAQVQQDSLESMRSILLDVRSEHQNPALLLELQRLDREMSDFKNTLRDSQIPQDSLEALKSALLVLQTQRQSYTAILARSLRPFGMLIFVEGIAWFLLRQYRNLIEDYKSFVRIYLKRSNYLIAFRAAPTAQAGSPLADVIKGLLNEDLTGRLAKDETTEALEARKDREQGPILESIKELKELVKVKLSSSH
jgi:tetratricopeptide (TPR) repeat protein